MHNWTNRKKLIAAGTVIGVLAITGIAVAYFTGGGSGSGTGTVGTSGTVTLTGTVADGIAPGLNRPVTFTAANATESAIQVTTVSLDSITPDAGHAACVTDDFTMADVTENHEVPAGATVEPLPTDGSLAMENTAISQDACKGATLTLVLSSL